MYHEVNRRNYLELNNFFSIKESSKFNQTCRFIIQTKANKDNYNGNLKIETSFELQENIYTLKVFRILPISRSG